MAKKSKPVVALRRPPPTAEVLDDFIHGRDEGTAASVQSHSETSTSALRRSETFVAPPEPTSTAGVIANEFRAEADAQQRLKTSVDVSRRLNEAEKPRGLVLRQGGKERRRRTVYLPPDLDQRLEEWCAEQGREVSHAIAEAVRKMLSGKR